MNPTKLVIVAAAVALFIGACGQSSQAPNAPTSKPDDKAAANSTANTSVKSAPPSEAVAGGGAYAENCQICHQESGKGGKNLTIQGKKISPADLTSDKIKKKSDQDLVKEISEGIPDEGMPAFKDKLKPDQMKQIVLHLRKLQGGPGPAPAS